MTNFTLHTPESAPDAAKSILAEAKQGLGFVPNLYAGLANVPPALQAYKSLAGYFDQTTLTPTERQVVMLVVSEFHACEFCVAAHSMIAKTFAGVPGSVVNDLRDGRAPADLKLAALFNFTRAILEYRGWVADKPEFAAFLSAGYTPEQGLEVILGVTQKTLSNYANHLLRTPLNSQLESERWTKIK